MKAEHSCEHCRVVDGEKEFGRVAIMPIKHRVRGIDFCIHHIVAALNAGNVPTTASCCGHGTKYGVIALEDGRVLVIHPDAPTDAKGWGELVTEGRLKGGVHQS